MLIKFDENTFVVPKIDAVLEVQQDDTFRYYYFSIVINGEAHRFGSSSLEEAEKTKAYVEEALQKYYGD